LVIDSDLGVEGLAIIAQLAYGSGSQKQELFPASDSKDSNEGKNKK
jgi:hypothetical protein